MSKIKRADDGHRYSTTDFSARILRVIVELVKDGDDHNATIYTTNPDVNAVVSRLQARNNGKYDSIKLVHYATKETDDRDYELLKEFGIL